MACRRSPPVPGRDLAADSEPRCLRSTNRGGAIFTTLGYDLQPLIDGVPALKTTSGGGLALMSEGLSLAGMHELPAVVMLAQRPDRPPGCPRALRRPG